MRIAILGLGLVGGSVALALGAREPGRWSISAWSPSGRGPAAAVRSGAIDRAAVSADDAVGGAELVVIASPPLDALALLPSFGPDGPATLTDVGSTKAAILRQADALGLRFVGGHPMAGRESTGWEAATDDLFVGRPWVVVAGEHARQIDLERVEALARACGALPIAMGGREHDEAVAAISHLPLVLAAALVEAVTAAPDWERARLLAASGWQDMTRLARGDVTMGAGIAATNAEALARRIRTLRAVLDAWLADLEGNGSPDPAALAARFRAARDRLDVAP